MPTKTFLGFLAIAISLAFVVACGNSSAKQAPTQRGAKAPAKDCKKDRSNLEDPWDGSYTLHDIKPTVTFVDIKPILTTHCVSCHAGYDTVSTARQKITAFVTRMDLEPSAAPFMPKGGQKISIEDRKKFIIWESIGMPETTGDPVSPSSPTPTLENGGPGNDSSPADC